MFPVGKEILKGSLALGLSLFSVWVASSGQHIQSADFILGLKAFSMIATMYALYRPFKILKAVTEFGQVDQLRVAQKEVETKFGPVPKNIWQTWLLLRQLSDSTDRRWTCLDVLTRTSDS